MTAWKSCSTCTCSVKLRRSSITRNRQNFGIICRGINCTILLHNTFHRTCFIMISPAVKCGKTTIELMKYSENLFELFKTSATLYSRLNNSKKLELLKLLCSNFSYDGENVIITINVK